MKKLSLYITPGHCSVEIENGASRQTRAATVPAMLAAMPDADRDTLDAFCRLVLATAAPAVTSGGPR